MSSTSQPTDLTDLRLEFINRMREPTGVTAINTVADRYLNEALVDVHILNPIVQPFWATRRATILTHAPYSTGTVAIAAAARTTVTGTSTLWNTAVTGMGFNNAQVGGKMVFSGQSDVYEVSAVGSDTAITLLNRYTGAVLTAATYTYFEDEYALAADFGAFVDIRMFSTDLEIPLIGEMDFRRRYVRNSIRGVPRVATFFQKGFLTTTAPRYRVALHPAPNDEIGIPYSYVTTNLAVSTAGVEQAALSATTDEPILPLRFRLALVTKAIEIWLRYYKDDKKRADDTQREYVDIMTRAGGALMIGQDKPQLVVKKGYGRFQRRRGRRFDVNDQFDQMLD